jgi:hypothetical protein
MAAVDFKWIFLCWARSTVKLRHSGTLHFVVVHPLQQPVALSCETHSFASLCCPAQQVWHRSPVEGCFAVSIKVVDLLEGIEIASYTSLQRDCWHLYLVGSGPPPSKPYSCAQMRLIAFLASDQHVDHGRWNLPATASDCWAQCLPYDPMTRHSLFGRSWAAGLHHQKRT